jgi:transcriptional regulator
MYIPASFAAPDREHVFRAIERYSFATLVSGAGSTLVASHLPLLLDRGGGPQGTLLGHMARANPQWRTAAGSESLAIFTGPHAYISPRWYEAPGAVPTWNYIAVHAYGPLELIDDRQQAEELLRRMIDVYEAGQPEPWRLEGPREDIERLLEQIVAFRIPLQRLEGKWKLHQNRPADQRAKVVAALERRTDGDSRAIADEMRLTPG